MKVKLINKLTLATILVVSQTVLASAQKEAQSTTNGSFKPTEKSLKQYKYPEWFRDAKFGIWAHWGPQAVPRQGDWYARKMYEEGSAEYKYHLAHYGHPSKFGYKDIIPLWKAQNWNPEKLMALYKKAGAKYFVSMGTHHDDFFLWDSKIHQWNSVNYGPKKDVVGIWQKAAKKEGLKFGVSEHLAASFTWFQSSHGADTLGDLAGVPYDGADPMYQDLYHAKAESKDKGWLSNNIEWQREWLFSIKELIDNYHPDLLYSDSGIPFGEYGQNMVAYFYNEDATRNGGITDVVYNCKQVSDGMWVQDMERGVQDSINPFPWQTDTSIGDWYYRTGQKYKSAAQVIQLLTDIVSKNGNLLLNIVQTPEGDLEPDVLQIVNGIADWMALNSEGIYDTRPWKIYGEGSSTIKANEVKGPFAGLSDTRGFNGTDIRFTTKGNTIYAYCLAKPLDDIKIKSLGKNSKNLDKEIASVTLLGSSTNLHWKQQGDALIIKKDFKIPVEEVPILGFKIEFK